VPKLPAKEDTRSPAFSPPAWSGGAISVTNTTAVTNKNAADTRQRRLAQRSGQGRIHASISNDASESGESLA
jgi:hypothetical protein